MEPARPASLPAVLTWSPVGRAAVFFLSATSIWCLLAEFYGIGSMRIFTLYVLIPAALLILAMALIDLARGDGRLWRTVAIGAIGGLLAAVAYDIFRLPFVVAFADKIGPTWLRLPLFKVFPRFGANPRRAVRARSTRVKVHAPCPCGWVDLPPLQRHHLWRHVHGDDWGCQEAKLVVGGGAGCLPRAGDALHALHEVFRHRPDSALRGRHSVCPSHLRSRTGMLFPLEVVHLAQRRTRRSSGARVTRRRTARTISFTALAILCLAGGCRRNPKIADDGPVVLYTSVDEPYARPLVEEFEKSTGLTVTLVTDSEAAKSVGLAEKLRAEKDQPRADVWWSNECFLTILLANEGVLAKYDSPAASDIPAAYKDPGRRWAGSVLRVRTLVSSKKIPGQPPRRTQRPPRPIPQRTDRHRPSNLRHHRRPCRRPLHALGTIQSRSLLQRPQRKWRSSARRQFEGRRTRRHLSARYGHLRQRRRGRRELHIGDLTAVLPNQSPDEDGTLAMPCTVAIVEGARHPAAARRLADFLLSARTDAALVSAKFAWCSSRDTKGKGKFITVDYGGVARQMPASIRRATSLLEGRPLD